MAHPEHREEVMTMELRMIPVDRIRIREGHNARADVGDVAELAESIRANGVLQALTVEELPDGDAFALVAGERRLTAARLVGLAEVPCAVRRDLDERQRTVVMLVENLQRQDLDPMDEASGIQRLAALGLSQREIATELGCSQSHVSKRLALLGLPEEIRGAVGQPADAGGISVAEALELTRLADQPQRLARAFKDGRNNFYGGIAGAVRGELQQLEHERAVTAARSQLMSAGVKILKEETHYSWWKRPEKPLQGCGHDHEAISLTVDQHRDEPCHAAAIERDGSIVYVCREPARHGAVDPKTARAEREKREQREAARLGREAAERRRETIAKVLAGANTSVLPFAARQVLSGWRVDESKLACQLLGIPPLDGRYSPSYTDALAEHASRSMAGAIKALLALALAAGEGIVGSSWGGVGERSRRHLELLVAAGYEPNDSDRKHLDGPGEELDVAELESRELVPDDDEEDLQ